MSSPAERQNQRRGFIRPLEEIVYARHGRELMGFKSVHEPCYQILRLAKVLAEGKRLRLAMHGNVKVQCNLPEFIAKSAQNKHYSYFQTNA